MPSPLSVLRTKNIAPPHLWSAVEFRNKTKKKRKEIMKNNCVIFVTIRICIYPYNIYMIRIVLCIPLRCCSLSLYLSFFSLVMKFTCVFHDPNVFPSLLVMVVSSHFVSAMIKSFLSLFLFILAYAHDSLDSLFFLAPCFL